MEFWEILSHVAGIFGFVLSLITAIVLILNERKNLDIIIYDVKRIGDYNFLMLNVINKSRLNISVYRMYIEQDSEFAIDHQSVLFRKITAGESVKEIYTLNLPVSICGLDSIRGIVRTVRSESTLHPATAKVIIYTSRGKFERRLIIGSDGCLSEPLSF